MIKICSPQLGISPLSSLGGEVYDYFTLKGFTEKGIKVLVYLPSGRYFDKTLKNFKVSYCFMKHIFPPWIYSFLSLPYLIRTYKKEKYDILRIHSPRFLGIAAFLFHKIYPEVPILSSAVTVDRSLAASFLEQLTFSISSKIIVQSEYMKQRLVKIYKIPSYKIAVTYGGELVGTLRWKKVPAEAKLIQSKDRILLFMGAFIRRKNPLFAVEVFESLKKKNDNLKLVLIGDGPLKTEIKIALSKKNILEDVIFIDKAYGEEKAYWFSRMDVFLLPSLDEGFGLVVTEAMSFAKPVVVSDQAAFKEIIKPNKDGFVLSIKDKTKWVKTISDLLRNRTLSSRIGKEAKRKVKREFNWKRTYDLNYKVIKELVA